MAELTSKPSPTVFGTKAGFNSCKLESSLGSTDTSPLNPLVYVRYRDHVVYKNTFQPQMEAAERETIGWLAKQNDEILLIEHDRAVQPIGVASGQGNTMIILRICIMEMHELPLQNNLNWHLNCKQVIIETESAFRPSERKTQPINKKGMDKKHCKR